MLYWVGPPGPAGDDCFAEAERMAQTAAERIKRDPWIQVFRLVKAEAERVDDGKLIEMYVRLFKAYEASRYSRDGDEAAIARTT
jgi:hypothetical protein